MISTYKGHLQQLIIIIIVSVIMNINMAEAEVAFRVDGGMISIEFDNQLNSRIISKIDGRDVVLGDFYPSEYITMGCQSHKNFRLIDHSVNAWQDKIGQGKEYHLSGSDPILKKEITITSYAEFPTMLTFQVIYTNIGDTALQVDSWTNNNYVIHSLDRKDETPFWSYQPGSYGWENDWIRPLKKGFTRDNYMGMTWGDYGGGTPVVDIWRQDMGLAVGHLEMVPKLVSLPVTVPAENKATLAVNFKKAINLKPGEQFSTLRTFVVVHRGDHFQTLSEYSRLMVRQGIEFKDPPEGVYGTIWCGWGYEKNFTMEQFYNTFPRLRNWDLIGWFWIMVGAPVLENTSSSKINFLMAMLI